MALIRGLFRGKFYFDHFMGFAGSGFPFPAANCLGSGLGEDRVAAFNINGLDAAIGRDERVDSYDSLERKIAGQRRVGRSSAIDEFARRALGVGVHRVQEHHGGEDQHADRALS
jgi:hypothetical protein